MSDNIRILLEGSSKINSKTISFTRFLILTLLAYFEDGLQYRELKASLKISDGKLISNLKQLKAFGYLEKSVAQIDNKELDIYYLTAKGKQELKKITEWMKLIQKVSQMVTINVKRH